MLDLMAQVAGQDVEERAALDVAGAEQLADVPARARLALDVARVEVVHAGREVAAEDDHEGPHVADDVGDRVRAEHPEEERTGERGQST